MEGLTNELNALIGKYGIRDVNKGLQTRMKDDYDYLKSLFAKEEKKVEKKEKQEVIEIVEVDVDADAQPSIEIKQEAPVVELKEKKFKDSKEQKIWQKEQEEKKLKENEAKGIKPKDLLTKENLKKWIEEDSRTYSYIAREYVGCKDSEVSAMAKAFGIENTRKNVMIQNSKK
jgi:hypothetical protein